MKKLPKFQIKLRGRSFSRLKLLRAFFRLLWSRKNLNALGKVGKIDACKAKQLFLDVSAVLANQLEKQPLLKCAEGRNPF